MTDELLDIVDDHDVIIDHQMRSRVHELGLQHRGVHVFLFTPDNKMLIQKRSADRVQAPSALDCSVSEHVRAGESYFDAAIRGLEEELSLTDIEIRPIIKFKMEYGVNDNEFSILYAGNVEPGPVKFDSVEIEQVLFLSAAEIEKMMQDETVLFTKWFVEIMNWYWGKPAAMSIDFQV